MSNLWLNSGKLVTQYGSVLICEDCPCIDSSSGGNSSSGTAGYFSPRLTCVEECRGDGLWPVTLYADISHVGGGGHDIDEQTVELTLTLNTMNQARWEGELDCGDPVIFWIGDGVLATNCDRGPDEVDNCKVFFGFTDDPSSGYRWGICHNSVTDELGNYLVGSAFITGSASASCDPIAFEYESIDPQGAALTCCEPGTCTSQEYDVLVRA